MNSSNKTKGGAHVADSFTQPIGTLAWRDVLTQSIEGLVDACRIMIEFESQQFRDLQIISDDAVLDRYADAKSLCRLAAHRIAVDDPFEEDIGPSAAQALVGLDAMLRAVADLASSHKQAFTSAKSIELVRDIERSCQGMAGVLARFNSPRRGIPNDPF